jgi:hypothetical protein
MEIIFKLHGVTCQKTVAFKITAAFFPQILLKSNLFRYRGQKFVCGKQLTRNLKKGMLERKGYMESVGGAMGSEGFRLVRTPPAPPPFTIIYSLL